jgi:peptide/nickel transport system substrate-binding protein
MSRKHTERLFKRVFASIIVIGALSVPSAYSSISATAQNADTLVVATVRTPNGVDPEFNFLSAEQQVRSALYDTLVTLGTRTTKEGLTVPILPRYKIAGGLAQSWAVSNGGRTFTYKLRHGVISHAGNELTAADVQYSWNRAKALGGSGAFYQGLVLGITKPTWRVVSKYSWQFSTPKPNALALVTTYNNDLDVLDSKEVKKHATKKDPWAKSWLATHDAGSGPFTLQEFKPGNRVVLAAYSRYFRGAPKFKTIIYKEVPQDANRLALVEAGSVDVAEYLAPSFVQQAQKAKSVTVWQSHGNTLVRLDLNWNIKPFDNPLVRQALLWATPYQQILANVFRGVAAPSRSSVPSTYPGYAGKWFTYRYDIAKAQALLKQANVGPFGFTLSVNSGDTTQTQSAILIKAAFEKIGVAVTIAQLSPAEFSSRLYSTEPTQQFAANFNPSFPILPDAGYPMILFYPCKNFLNNTHYCNAKFEATLTKSTQTLNPSARATLLSQAQRFLAQDAAGAYIAEVPWFLVTRKNVKGVSWTLTNTENFFSLRR